MKLRRLLLLTALAALLAIFCVRLFHTGRTTARPKPAVTAQSASQVPALVRALRPAYPFSVIPGGIYSRSELATQAGRDNLVSTHYSDFRVESAHLAVLQKDLMAYVSYRKNNSIFWTRKQLRVPKGELVMTDGTHLARARCGNRLSEIAGEPTAPEDPTADLNLGQLTAALLRDRRIAFVPPPELPITTITTPPNVFLTPGEIASTPSSRVMSGITSPVTSPVTSIAVLSGAFPTGSSIGTIPGIPPAVILPYRAPAPNIPSPVSAVPEPADLVLPGLALIAGTYSIWQRRKRRTR
jgi:hypothetical protein